MTIDWNHLPQITLPTPVLALAPGPGGTWAGGHGGVAWHSAGRWRSQTPGLPLTSVAALAYAGGWLLAGGAGGLARSRDGGQTWQAAQLQDTPSAIAAIAPSPRFAEDTTVLAASLGGGVLRSEDAGERWRTANLGLQNHEATAILWTGGDTVLVGTADGIYRSPNGGRVWRECPGSAGRSVAALAALPGGLVLAVEEQGGLLGSHDDGRIWSPQGQLPPGIQSSALLATADAVLLGSLSHGLLRSTDLGATWQPASGDAVLALAADRQKLYVGTETGLLISADGGATWAAQPASPLHDLRRLLVVGGQPLVYGVHSLPVCRRPDGGWLALGSVPLPLTGIAAAPDSALLAASTGGLARSTDGGDTWETVVADAAGCIAHLSFRPDGAGWAGSADGATLLRTGDCGQSWQPLEAPFGVLPLAALQTTSSALIAATYDPRRQAAQLWRSPDGGVTWERGAQVRTDWPIVATHDRPALLTLGGYAFVERGPERWEQVHIGGGVRRVVGHDRALLALTTAGIQRSADDGATWERDDAGLPAEQVMDIALAGDRLYVLMAAGEVWWRAI